MIPKEMHPVFPPDTRRSLVIDSPGEWDNEQLKISPEIHRALVYHGWMPPDGPECTESAPNLDIEGMRRVVGIGP